MHMTQQRKRLIISTLQSFQSPHLSSGFRFFFQKRSPICPVPIDVSRAVVPSEQVCPTLHM